MSDISRRHFVRVGGLTGAAAVLAACAPAAAPAQPAAPAAAPAQPAAPEMAPWEKEWEQLVEAANKEGTLALVTTIGDTFRKAVAGFEEAFPKITVEHTSLNASAFAPRVTQERDGSIYNYDAITSTYGTVPLVLIPAGVMDPIRPILFRGDILDDSIWQDGFEAGFLDNDKKWSYAGFSQVHTAVSVNTDLVKEGEIKGFDDLLNPKWKGQIIGGDPRTYGGGWWPGTALRLTRGDDACKKLWIDQEMTFSRDARQMMDFLIKGRKAIGIGAVSDTILATFLEEGVGKNLKKIPIDELDNLNHGSNVLYYFNRAPHPNAAKLFLNWILTKEGAEIWSEHAKTNSRRKDVAPAVPALAITPGRKLTVMDREVLKPEWTKTRNLAKELLN